MYQILENIDGSKCVRKNGPGNWVALIPMDEANADYQQYLAWLAEGNEPEVIDLSG